MAKMVEDMNKEELQNEILFNEDGLYDQFDEALFLKGAILHEELLSTTSKWIEENNEATI